MDHPKLKAEIQSDPVGMVYGAWTTTADDNRIAGIINDPTKRTLVHVVIPSWKVITCYDAVEFSNLTTLQLQKLTSLTSPGYVDFANSNVRAICATIFPAGGPTRAAFVALWNEQIQTQSRADELSFETIYPIDVTVARVSY